MSYDEEILETLFKSRVWLTTSQVAKKVEISWNTAESYLNDLEQDQYVLHKKSGNRDLWKFNFIKWKKMKKNG
jgi:Mn-dependent DtxR family transcriptional regulator